MAKDWYVIHTYAGFEGRVKTSLMERANQMGLTEKVGQILVPTEDVIEIKDGKRRTSRRKFSPVMSWWSWNRRLMSRWSK